MAVRDLRVNGLDSKARAVLMNLATRANDSDEAWPSAAHVSEDTGISVRGVARALKDLAVAGVVEVRSGRFTGRANVYKLLVKVCHDDAPQERRAVKEVCQTAARGSATVTEKSGQGSVEREKKKSVRSSVCAEPQPKLINIPTRDVAEKVCYELGASARESQMFWRYNQARGWAILRRLDLKDAARLWIDNIMRKDPEGYAYELERRQNEERQRELARIEADIRRAQNAFFAR